MVEVVGITDDAEGVVEAVLDDAPARPVGEGALQVLGAFSRATKAKKKPHSIIFPPASQSEDVETTCAASPPAPPRQKSSGQGQGKGIKSTDSGFLLGV